MAMGYCFFCDQSVDGDTCPTCGRPVWHDDTAEDQSPTAYFAASSVPEPDEDSTPWRPRPWMIAGTVVVVGLVLSILTVPSGFQQVTTPTPPPAVTTTTTLLSGPSLPTYPLRRGTWLGLVRAEAPPKSLTGSFPFLEPADDVMYDGSLILHTGTSYVRSTPDGVRADIPIGSPGHFVDVELSPNGRLLATVDKRGAVAVWNLSTSQLTEFEAIDETGPLLDGHIYWSPDSQTVGLDDSGDHCYEWRVDGTLLTGPLPGRLVAVGIGARLAVAGDEGLTLTSAVSTDIATTQLGRNLTTFSDIQAAEFNPSSPYLAVDASVSGQGSGVWVVALGDPRQNLVAPSGSSFTWSGDGSALFWTDQTGTYAYPLSSVYGVARVNDQTLGRGDHLRIYDPDLVVVPTFLVHSGDLFELEDGQIQLRSPGGLTVLDIPSGGTTVSIIDATSFNPDLPLLRTAERDDGSLVVSQVTPTGLLEHLVGTLPSGSGPATSALDAPGSGEFIATDQDGVFRLGPDETLDPVMEGGSPGIIGTVPFAVTSGSIKRLPRDGEEPETLLDIAGLAGAADILDAIGIRAEMVVLARTQVGTASIYWVPGDSELFGSAILPNSPIPSNTPFSLVYTPTNNRAFETGRIVPAGDGQTFAVELHYADGVETVLMAAPAPGQSTCNGQVVCPLYSVAGRALGFSPDGAWLLVDTDGAYVAMSTRGRGSVRIDETAPDGVAWIP
jgi:hypothetical protein